MVQRMVGPAAISASRLALEVGVGQPTLSKWLREAQGSIGAVKFDSPPPPPATPRRPEDWSPEERLQAVLEASRLKDDELGCRRPSRSAEIWSTGVRADLGARVWMESKRPSATIGCAGPHVLLGFARQAFGGFFPALVGVVGLVRCR